MRGNCKQNPRKSAKVGGRSRTLGEIHETITKSANQGYHPANHHGACPNPRRSKRTVREIRHLPPKKSRSKQTARLNFAPSAKFSRTFRGASKQSAKRVYELVRGHFADTIYYFADILLTRCQILRVVLIILFYCNGLYIDLNGFLDRFIVF
jgi:hypothetical protein